MMGERSTSHWIVRMNYRNRALVAVLLFLTLGSHLLAGGSLFAWSLLVAQFLIYPHLAYLIGRRAADPVQLEWRLMNLDVFLNSAWTAALGFPAWIGFILLQGSTLNLVVFRGLKGLLPGMAAVGAGLLAGWTLARPAFQPETSSLTTALCMVTMFLYLIALGHDSYARAMRLHRARDAVRSSEQTLARRVEEIQSLQSQLRDQAEHDPLTGLHNRRYLAQAMPGMLSRMIRERQPLSVMLLDIDHFKAINDTHGHLAGDTCLVQLARLLREHIRESDIVCRWGGEEFLVLLPSMPAAAALERAERYRREFQALAPPWGDAGRHPTLSIGVAAFPQDGGDTDTLLAAADAALYRAKARGRNRVEQAQRREQERGQAPEHALPAAPFSSSTP